MKKTVKWSDAFSYDSLLIFYLFLRRCCFFFRLKRYIQQCRLLCPYSFRPTFLCQNGMVLWSCECLFIYYLQIWNEIFKVTCQSIWNYSSVNPWLLKSLSNIFLSGEVVIQNFNIHTWIHKLPINLFLSLYARHLSQCLSSHLRTKPLSALPILQSLKAAVWRVLFFGTFRH